MLGQFFAFAIFAKSKIFMSEAKRYTVTAALPYANGPLHIGHIAGAYLPADTYVRYLRAKGKDVVFICGSDEHGAAITIQAKKEGVSPQEIVDKYHAINKQAFVDFGIDFDIYHRTSSKLHHETASAAFTKLHDKGTFTEQTSEQFYDEEFNQFLADRYITGTCPNCGYDSAYGDQCENCGKSLSPQDLIKPKSTLSGKTPVVKQTKHWYLPLDKYQDWLKIWLEKGEWKGKQQHDPKTWKKNVLGQTLSWLKEGDGLKPRAITRDLDWGVPVPVEDAEGKVLYVWLDAPIGYISATKQWAADNGENWEDYWKKDDSHLVHFIGKDNIVFHCIIFPSILNELGDYILPINVPANEFLNLEGKKISTSRNWAVWLHEYMEDFPDRKDELRYVLTSIAPETSDSEFTWGDYQTRVNSELVAILGNFVNRVLVLSNKYYDNVVPEPKELSADAKELLASMASIKANTEGLIEKYRFREAQAEMMMLARAGNKYLADKEPWKLIKTDPEAVKEIMYTAIQVVANIMLTGQVFLPTTSIKLRAFLNAGEDISYDRAGAEELIPAGHQLGTAGLLFQKVEDEEVAKQVEKLEASAKANAGPSYEPVGSEIQFDDFVKIDLRVGEIIAAEKVKKADKLLQLTLDMGFEQRTVLSGIAQYFSPEAILGQKVSVVANLAPRKMRGIESQGMVLMAEDADGKLVFVAPPADFPNGSVIR